MDSRPEDPKAMEARVRELEAEVGALREVADRLARGLEETRAHLEEARVEGGRFRTIFESSPLAVMYTNREGAIIACNEPAIRLFGAPRERLVGFSYREIKDERMRTAVADALSGRATRFEGEYRTVTGDVVRHMRADFGPGIVEDGSIDGVIGVFEDVSVRLQLESEREELIGRLRNALAEVKVLQGILPICASCKSIRDDQGYWKALEEYVQTHTAAQFSHGICPECAERLYPELVSDPSRD